MEKTEQTNDKEEQINILVNLYRGRLDPDLLRNSIEQGTMRLRLLRESSIQTHSGIDDQEVFLLPVWDDDYTIEEHCWLNLQKILKDKDHTDYSNIARHFNMKFKNSDDLNKKYCVNRLSQVPAGHEYLTVLGSKVMLNIVELSDIALLTLSGNIHSTKGPTITIQHESNHTIIHYNPLGKPFNDIRKDVIIDKDFKRSLINGKVSAIITTGRNLAHIAHLIGLRLNQRVMMAGMTEEKIRDNLLEDLLSQTNLKNKKE